LTLVGYLLRIYLHWITILLWVFVIVWVLLLFHCFRYKCPHDGSKHYKKIAILQLSYATNFQLHATHAIARPHSCIKQVAHD
jgi:hypothetical protein